MAVTSMANSSITNSRKFRRMSAITGAPPFSCGYLIVAGGGGGGTGFTATNAYWGAGGGAGGYLSNIENETVPDSNPAVSGTTTVGSGQLLSLPAGSYSIIVGAGGPGKSTTVSYGDNGSNSTFHLATALGGGGGGSGGSGGVSGGSGGGGGAYYIYYGGAGTANQGHTGGSSHNNSAGGGGGASAVGDNGLNAGQGGDGGAGISSSVTGSAVARGGGGGGGSNTSPAGIGGTGGGGNGAQNGTAGSGVANTGGGGGGARDSGGISGNGGSGVVIFTLPKQALATFSAGVTYTTSSVGDNTVYTVTATSTTSETVTIV